MSTALRGGSHKKNPECVKKGRLTVTDILSVDPNSNGINGVNPKFCVNAKLRCKIEQKCFKTGAAQAAAAFSTKITALRGDVKGGGVSPRSS